MNKNYYALLALCVVSLFVCSQVEAKCITPEQYGAAGDGITDDTEAFITALKENDILCIKGHYKISHITVPPGKMLKGVGKAVLLYMSIDVLDNCLISGITFDGQWNTRGVQVLGSNVKIDDCVFVHTKGTKQYYGGLTSSLWIGKYQDLNDNYIKYYNVVVNKCVFDGCEPLDAESHLSVNKTIARYIYSYGCDNLQIKLCTFKNMHGTYDSDAIQLCSYAIKSDHFPFGCLSDSTLEVKPPFLGHYYAGAKTIIRDCLFEQGDNKSSIKIMSSDVEVKGNRFVLNNSKQGKSYSIVRMHYSTNVRIKKNTIDIKDEGYSNSIFKIGNSKNVLVQNNTIYNHNENNDGQVILDASYSLDCKINNNKIHLISSSALLAFEYNDNLSLNRNKVEVDILDFNEFVVFRKESNHYSYPMASHTTCKVEKNKISIKKWRGGMIDLSNRYDFPIEFKKNILQRDGISYKAKVIQ